MSEPYYQDDQVTLHHGDCLDVLADMPESSVDAICTDPPYGISFMGRQWDQPGQFGSQRSKGAGDSLSREGKYDHRTTRERGGAMVAGEYDRSLYAMQNFQSWCQQWATECLRVLKPGGHMLAFGGSRTWHRLAAAIEDAGFEIRDSIAWLYGSGFPKSLDVSKAIDKAAGAEREVLATGTPVKRMIPGADQNATSSWIKDNGREFVPTDTAPATDAAKQWQGWGTALKPAFEPIVVARKPLTGTVAANALAHGTGALNIDACRVGTPEDKKHPGTKTYRRFDPGSPTKETQVVAPYTAGRWPANVVLDGDMADELDKQTGVLAARGNVRPSATAETSWFTNDGVSAITNYDNGGGASRFFPTFRYTAKAATTERPTYKQEGSERSSYAPKRCTKCGNQAKNMTVAATCQCAEPDFQTDPAKVGVVSHPTVKPLDLMRWLVRLVTPPGGVVLDPFAGSGTVGEAAIHEHKHAVLIEREPTYLPLIVARLSKPMAVGFDFGAGA